MNYTYTIEARNRLVRNKRGVLVYPTRRQEHRPNWGSGQATNLIGDSRTIHFTKVTEPRP